jgi:hypothetical protein
MGGRAGQNRLKLRKHGLELVRGEKTLDTEDKRGGHTSLHSISQKVSKGILRDKLVRLIRLLRRGIDPGVPSEATRVGSLMSLENRQKLRRATILNTSKNPIPKDLNKIRMQGGRIHGGQELRDLEGGNSLSICKQGEEHKHTGLSQKGLSRANHQTLLGT